MYLPRLDLSARPRYFDTPGKDWTGDQIACTAKLIPEKICKSSGKKTVLGSSAAQDDLERICSKIQGYGTTEPLSDTAALLLKVILPAFEPKTRPFEEWFSSFGSLSAIGNLRLRPDALNRRLDSCTPHDEEEIASYLFTGASLKAILRRAMADLEDLDIDAARETAKEFVQKCCREYWPAVKKSFDPSKGSFECYFLKGLDRFFRRQVGGLFELDVVGDPSGGWPLTFQYHYVNEDLTLTASHSRIQVLYPTSATSRLILPQIDQTRSGNSVGMDWKLLVKNCALVRRLSVVSASGKNLAVVEAGCHAVFVPEKAPDDWHVSHHGPEFTRVMRRHGLAARPTGEAEDDKSGPEDQPDIRDDFELLQTRLSTEQKLKLACEEGLADDFRLLRDEILKGRGDVILAQEEAMEQTLRTSGAVVGGTAVVTPLARVRWAASGGNSGQILAWISFQARKPTYVGLLERFLNLHGPSGMLSTNSVSVALRPLAESEQMHGHECWRSWLHTLADHHTLPRAFADLTPAQIEDFTGMLLRELDVAITLAHWCIVLREDDRKNLRNRHAKRLSRSHEAVAEFRGKLLCCLVALDRKAEVLESIEISPLPRVALLRRYLLLTPDLTGDGSLTPLGENETNAKTGIWTEWIADGAFPSGVIRPSGSERWEHLIEPQKKVFRRELRSQLASAIRQDCPLEGLASAIRDMVLEELPPPAIRHEANRPKPRGN